MVITYTLANLLLLNSGKADLGIIRLLAGLIIRDKNMKRLGKQFSFGLYLYRHFIILLFNKLDYSCRPA